MAADDQRDWVGQAVTGGNVRAQRAGDGAGGSHCGEHRRVRAHGGENRAGPGAGIHVKEHAAGGEGHVGDVLPAEQGEDVVRQIIETRRAVEELRLGAQQVEELGRGVHRVRGQGADVPNSLGRKGFEKIGELLIAALIGVPEHTGEGSERRVRQQKGFARRRWHRPR